MYDDNMVGRLIDWEQGTMEGEAVKQFFQDLVDNDLVEKIADDFNPNIRVFANHLLNQGVIKPHFGVN